MKRILTLLMLIVLVTTARADGNHYVGTATSSDGVTIAYEAWGKGLPAIVFVHGWSCDRTYWQDQIEFFAADRQVVAIDLAGHGESSMERTDYTIAAFGDDVAVVLERHGITDAILVGHSMGGPVVVEAALLVTDRVRGVIGVDNFQSMKEEFPPTRWRPSPAPSRRTSPARSIPGCAPCSPPAPTRPSSAWWPGTWLPRRPPWP